MSHTDNEKREAPWSGPEMGGPELVVQFTDSLASLRLLSTSSLAIVPRDISPLSIAADTSASVATGTLAIAIFTCARRTKSVRIRLRSFKMLKTIKREKERIRNSKAFLFPLSFFTIHRERNWDVEQRVNESWIVEFFFFFFFTRKGKVEVVREKEREKEESRRD